MSRIGVRGALLAAFLVASGAPLLVFWLWPHSATLQSEMDEVRERHLLHARNVGAALERYDLDVRSVFEGFAPLMARGADMEFARKLLKDLRFRHFCVINPETGKIERAFLSDGVTVPEVAPPAMVARMVALADADLALSPVMAGTERTPPQLVMADWVQGQLVVAAIDTVYFQHLAGQIDFGAGGHAAIVDRLGQVISHPNKEWTATAKDITALEPVRRMMAGESGVTTFVSPALNAEVVAGFAAVPGPGWGVMVPQPVSELRAKADKVTRQALVVFAAGLLLSAITALVVSAHLARSIGSVSAAAIRMARGQADSRVSDRLLNGSLSELSRLGQCFNAMASQVQEARDKVTTLARTDALTGLSNRAAFVADAEARLRELKKAGGTATLYFVDVDRLKAINDGFGHPAGDRLLAQVARRLSEVAGPSDLIARQGGDEFLMLHADATDPRSPEEFGQALLASLSQPFRVERQRLSVTASVGASLWPHEGDNLEDLIRQADQAMYVAKQSGRNGVRVFDPALRSELAETAYLARELEAALSAGTLDVAYQPILDLATGQLAGFEALARWDRGVLGPVAPEVFVPLAEQTGQIAELGRFVRARAFGFAATLASQGTAVPIAVNLSQIELAQPGLTDDLLSAASLVGLRPQSIILEITESPNASPDLAPEAVEALHKAGFSLSIDDFGKGLSSYSRLLAYRADRLKVDATFAGSLTTDRQAREVVASLLKLGKSLGLRTTVEGIETAAELDHAVRMGADEVQGFWHRRPMAASAALRYATESRLDMRPVKLAG